jgi:hypothetical protein
MEGRKEFKAARGGGSRWEAVGWSLRRRYFHWRKTLFASRVQRLWQIPLLQLIRAIVRRKEYVAGKCLGQFFHEGFLHLGLVLTVAEIEICF